MIQPELMYLIFSWT